MVRKILPILPHSLESLNFPSIKEKSGEFNQIFYWFLPKTIRIISFIAVFWRCFLLLLPRWTEHQMFFFFFAFFLLCECVLVLENTKIEYVTEMVRWMLSPLCFNGWLSSCIDAIHFLQGDRKRLSGFCFTFDVFVHSERSIFEINLSPKR